VPAVLTQWLLALVVNFRRFRVYDNLFIAVIIVIEYPGFAHPLAGFVKEILTAKTFQKSFAR
jgi:hypothetical protein